MTTRCSLCIEQNRGLWPITEVLAWGRTLEPSNDSSNTTMNVLYYYHDTIARATAMVVHYYNNFWAYQHRAKYDWTRHSRADIRLSYIGRRLCTTITSSRPTNDDYWALLLQRWSQPSSRQFTWTRHKWADICLRYKGRWLSITITTFGSTNGDHCRHDQHCKCNNDGQHCQYDCHDHDLQWTWLCNHDEYVLRLPLLSQPSTRVVNYHYHDQHCKRNHVICALLLPHLSQLPLSQPWVNRPAS